MPRLGWLLALICSPSLAVFGQDCPSADANGVSVPSAAQTLEGALIHHDGIRQWFELKLDKPQCGQPSIQLTSVQGNYAPLEVLRGCRVRSTGVVDESPTGYFSLDLYQDVTAVEPVGACARKPLFPNYSKASPDRSVQKYRVEMLINYEPGDHPVQFRVTSAGRELRPWQAYASYWLTGGFVLYGHCGKGFVVDRVFGTAAASPGHFTQRGDPSDMAMYDPESAAAVGNKHLLLGYTCVRAH